MFELVIALLFIGALLTLWSNRLGVPYPALLALAGAVIALMPGAPQVMLDPQLALALFVAPILLDAAYDASPRDLKKNLRPVASLALVVVAITIAAVALVARHIVPDMSWPAAIALGAIVAPPDASAATTVLRRLKPPHRLLVILEGESLFNDASALLAYRVAVGVAMGGAFEGWKLIPTLLLTCGGGVVVGAILSRLYIRFLAQVEDIAISVMLQFVSTFATWIIADRLGVSAILAVVTSAMTIAQRVPGRVDARHRIASYAVWEVGVFVLNVLAFVLIGLQLRTILSRMHGSDWRTYSLCALAVCAAVIVTRLVYVMAYNRIARWRMLRENARAAASEAGARPRRQLMLPTIGTGLVIAWCGMRGIVTLAAALALPDGSPSEAFPYRDLIILCAFCVVLSTLVVQGLTLKPLMTWLGLEDDGSVDRELRLARAETARAALRMLSAQSGHPSIATLRREYEARIRLGEAQLAAADGQPSTDTRLSELQRRAVVEQRRVLVRLRAEAVIGDDAFHAAEEEIDLLELSADERIRAIAEEGSGGPALHQDDPAKP